MTEPTPESLRSALACVHEIIARARGGRMALFLDYDGTLTPIVDRPELAVMSEKMRSAVRNLAVHCAVAVVSGRTLDEVRNLVKLDGLVYAGTHGFEILGPEGTQMTHQVGRQYESVVARAAELLHERLAGIEGVLIECKRVSVATHYRLVEQEDVVLVERAVDEVVGVLPELRKSHGKMVYELQPKIDWHKGRAVQWLMKELNLGPPDALVVYIGDDVTDEDAFRSLKGTGVGIVVVDHERPTAADYTLTDTDEVMQFLNTVASLQRGGHP